jgi:hypothetical protein
MDLFRPLDSVTDPCSLEYFERQWGLHRSVPGSDSGHW